MPLPWVRLDANIATHDKVLALLADPSPKRWQAAFSYVSALGWSGGHETDGVIRSASLPFVHGNKTTARLLVKHQLWDEIADGWQIRNYADRQQTKAVTEARSADLALFGEKGGCKTHHGPDCWRPGVGCGKKRVTTIRAVKP